MRTRGLQDVESRLGPVADILRGFGASAAALEVGCGFGHAMKELQLACPDAQLTGMNVRPYPEQVPGQHYVYGDAATALPLPDESVDLVYSIVTLYFLADRARFLEEAYRVLRPGGQLRINLHRDILDAMGHKVAPEFLEKLLPYRLPDAISEQGTETALRDYILALPGYDIRLESAQRAPVTVLRKRAGDPPLRLGLIPIDESRLDYGTLFGDPAEGFLRVVYSKRT